MWKEPSGQMEEEVLTTYKVEETTKGVCKGRSEPLEWPIVKEVQRNINLAGWRGDCWAGNFLFSQRRQSAAKKTYADRGNRRRGDEATAKNEHYGRYDEEDTGKMQMDAKQSW